MNYKLSNNEGGVCWFTGLSCAGKTTQSKALYSHLSSGMKEILLLDGEQVRTFSNNSLGYSKEDRILHLSSLQNLVKVISDQGIFVIVAALYSNENVLEWNKLNYKNYFEIYMDASFSVLSDRDRLGLYSEESDIVNVVGKDIIWVPPVKPDMIINTDNSPPPKLMAEKILDNISFIEEY